MSVQLHGRTYRIIRTLTGETIVIVQQSRHIWRVVTGRVARLVLAGRNLEIVRNG